MLVQKLRLQRGWSQQQLAELSGLNVRTIQRIEKGQEPSVESLKSLAAVFNVEFSTLKEQGMDNVISESQRFLHSLGAVCVGRCASCGHQCANNA
jgi:transcriptional regulator with XRE-family HTH domain